MEYNRLISEQRAPAKRRVESRKDRGDKEKRKCREEKERREIKHAFNSLKRAALLLESLRCGCVCVCVCKHSSGCICDDVTLLIADMFAASHSKPDR